MKKIVSLIIGIFTIAMVGCSNTKVLEENTKGNKTSDKYKITERNIENKYKDKLFMPLFYNSEGIYGSLSPATGGYVEELRIGYLIDNNGILKEVGKGTFTEEEIAFIKDKVGYVNSGVCFIEGNRTSEREFYYIDLLNKIKIKLDGYEKIYNIIELKFNFLGSGGHKLEGNENYYIHIYSKMDNEGNIDGNQEILVIDIKNEKFYTITDIDAKYFYYDSKENSIMTIDSLGKIYKVILEEGNTKCEFYKDINLNDLKIYNKYGYSRCYILDDNLILNVYNNGSKSYSDRSNILYNINSGEVTLIDPEKTILEKVDNTDFFIILYNENKYLAEVNDNGEINLTYKLDDSEGYKYLAHVSSKKGNNLFLSRIKYNEEGSKEHNSLTEKEDIKYSILEIEEK